MIVSVMTLNQRLLLSENGVARRHLVLMLHWADLGALMCISCRLPSLNTVSCQWWESALPNSWHLWFWCRCFLCTPPPTHATIVPIISTCLQGITPVWQRNTSTQRIFSRLTPGVCICALSEVGFWCELPQVETVVANWSANCTTDETCSSSDVCR